MTTTDSAAADAADALGFGQHFTPHLVSGTWSDENGWSELALEPYGPLVVDPATVGLHYGQVVFEGLKAYRQQDGRVAVFRPDEHGRRFAASARRLAMPELPVDSFVNAVRTLVTADWESVPEAEGQSLYLRPLMFASEANLALRPARSYRFVTMAFRAGSFFDPSAPAVSVWASREYARAIPNGTGAAKCAGNYGATLLAQAEAAEHGCQQVLWLDSREHRWVEELGGMNLFYVRGSGPSARVMTPPLTGTLLAGVTRASLLTLATDLGLEIADEPITLDALRQGCESGEITEVFACGTAAVVSPVGEVHTDDTSWKVGTGGPGPVTERLRQVLVDTYYGRAPDPHGWLLHVPTP
ncbi:branched-chain amino acid aminotransferase [Streptomyces sp. NPDC059906]|uniref:branched-chain amino acid aminotransferase n=1 Tax=Streptomyces sp. NPDC059906 TaxID=3346997 RepID=UPI0036521DE9